MTSEKFAITERRSFGIHPGLLLTVMREQAGSVDKALAELIMNSIDAGATKIELKIDKDGFELKDDGVGFATREQLENFFEFFGTPHKEGDSYYGKFRVGRGQIMSYGKTTWRSGPFEMLVDMKSEAKDMGYDLRTHAESVGGCTITGCFYDRYHFYEYESNWGVSYEFRHFIKYAPVPVLVNGRQCNTPAQLENWDFENEYAYYRFDKLAEELSIYNLGVFVEKQAAARHGLGGIIVSKKALTVNMARNSLIEHRCETWRFITKALKERFALRLTKAKKLNPDEAAKLLDEILFDDCILDESLKNQIKAIRFIPNIFGELITPTEFFSLNCFTLFDGKNRMIAERVQKSKRATVVMTGMFRDCRLDPLDEENICRAISRLHKKLFYWNGQFNWRPFEDLVVEFDGAHEILQDQELEPEQLIVLDCLRELNWSFARSFSKEERIRTLFAGKSDHAAAWTDGVSYIAIRSSVLSIMRDDRATKLVAVMAHEYSHLDPSDVSHSHDYAFYEQFHTHVLGSNFSMLVSELQRKYLSRICKAGIVPGRDFKYNINHIVKWAPKIATRIKKVQQ